MQQTTATTNASATTTAQNNYRIYDRTGGGVTHDIYAESLDDAIERGRAWIEEGDWGNGGGEDSGEGRTYHIGIDLDCEVRAIVRVPDLRSITSLPAILDASVLPDGAVRVECGPETVLSMLPGRVIDVSQSDADGYYDVVLADVALPLMIDEDATLDGDSHDCSGEYSETLPDCEQRDHASDDDEQDDEGHDWRSPYSVVGARMVGQANCSRLGLCKQSSRG